MSLPPRQPAPLGRAVDLALQHHRNGRFSKAESIFLPGEEFAGLLDEMDIYPETPAFSGCTTVRQAVHRGISLVTDVGTGTCAS